MICSFHFEKRFSVVTIGPVRAVGHAFITYISRFTTRDFLQTGGGGGGGCCYGVDGRRTRCCCHRRG